MEDEIILEGEIEEIEGESLEPDVATCFGEYGKRPHCSSCWLRKKCKKFTEAEKEVTLKHKGKYGFRGKERRRDKY